MKNKKDLYEYRKDIQKIGLSLPPLYLCHSQLGVSQSYNDKSYSNSQL
jgi:hypothetical protein